MTILPRHFPTALLLAVALAGCATAGANARNDMELPQRAGEAATQLPATPGGGRFIVPHDLLEITVLEAPELSRTTRVSDSGDVSLPLLGQMRAAGNTPMEFETAVAHKLRETYMKDPHVTVEVKEAAAQPIYVLGEVNQPGAFTTAGREGLTVLQAVAMARGVKPSGSMGRSVLIRTAPNGERHQLPVALDDVLRGRARDVVLQANDVLYVPKNTERAVALGLVDALVRVVTFRAVF
jgi:polysaccharide biosynthesis/export protein